MGILEERAAMRGFVVVGHETAGRMRREGAALPACAVLDCSGPFAAGDRVCVVVRGRDGGQGVFATGIARCSATVLHSRKDPAPGGPTVIDANAIEPLWLR